MMMHDNHDAFFNCEIDNHVDDDEDNTYIHTNKQTIIILTLIIKKNTFQSTTHKMIFIILNH